MRSDGACGESFLRRTGCCPGRTRGFCGRWRWCLPLSAFTDGMSNTVAFSEKRVGSGSSPYNPARDWIGGVMAGGPVTADDWVALCSSLAPDQAQAAVLTPVVTGCSTRPGSTTSLPRCRPTALFPTAGTGKTTGTGVFAARSYHPGGVNAAMADGSVRWFASSVSMRTCARPRNLREGEAVDQGSY